MASLAVCGLRIGRDRWSFLHGPYPADPCMFPKACPTRVIFSAHAPKCHCKNESAPEDKIALFRKNEVDDLAGDYGRLIVDECHHISARSFEAVARRCKARYVTGLSATVTRKDGHHPIIVMQCGPIRYHVDERRQAAQRPFKHRVLVRRTEFTLPHVFRYLQGRQCYP